MNSYADVHDGTRDHVERCVIEAIVSFGADRKQVTAEASLAALDTDLLDILELSQIVDHRFGVKIRAKHAEGLNTVGEVIDFVVTRLTANGGCD